MILGPRLSRSTSLLSTLVVLGAYLMNSPAAAAACRFSRVGLTGPPDSPNTLLFIPSNLSNYLPQTSSVSIFIIRKVPYHIVVGGKQITCFYRVFNLRVSNKYNLYADDSGHGHPSDKPDQQSPQKCRYTSRLPTIQNGGADPQLDHVRHPR